MSRRGQTLVLAAMSVLLLVLMVLITISIGTRVKQRVELQEATDAAAYSEAVALARTLNQIALMNRTAVALEVAALGMAATIDYSSHHVSNLVALEQGLSEIHQQYVAECDPIFNPCPCTQIGPTADSLQAVSDERQRIEQLWDGEEQSAAQQLDATWKAAAWAGTQTTRALDQFRQQAKGQALVQQLLRHASAELAAPPDGDRKTLRELEHALYRGDPKKKALQATVLAMGTRGFSFVTARNRGERPSRERLEKLARTGNPSASVDPAIDEGGAGFGKARHDLSVDAVSSDGLVWGEDHGGALQLDWPCGCSKSASPSVANSRLGSGPQGEVSPEHRFTPGDRQPANQRHRLGGGAAGLWPDFESYNFDAIADESDDFGQPKLYALVTRDLDAVSRKPWELGFDLTVQNGAHFDGRGSPSQRQQAAVSSAQVYYHRPDAWAEPPNLFNPFWRATLVAADRDVPGYLRSAGLSEKGDAVSDLMAAGLKVTR